MGLSYISRLFKFNLSTSEDSIIGISQTAKTNYENIRKHNNSKGYATLENFLNELFYPTHSENTSGGLVGIQDAFAQAYQKKVETILNSVNISDLNDIAVYQPILLGNQSSIAGAHLTGYVETLKNELSKRSIKTVEDVEALKIDLEGCKDDLTKKIGNLYITLLGKARDNISGRIRGKIIDEIAELEAEGIYLTKLAYVQKQLGDALEDFLGIAKEVMENFTEEKAQELINGLDKGTVSAGKDVVQGAVRTGDIVLTSQGQVYEASTQKIKKSSQKVYRFGDTAVSVHAFGGFQQKMDVKFDIPGPDNAVQPDSMRISAKSWNGTSGKDLGSTTLLNALLRTANVDSTLAFGLQLKHSGMQSLHKWAKTIAIMDIAAGIAQKNGYTDTLVVQDRTNKCFHIYDMSMILSSALQDNGSFHLKGYDEGMASNMGFETHKKIGPQNWRTAITGALQAQNISITTTSFSK